MKGVVDMLNVNMGLMPNEQLLVVTEGGGDVGSRFRGLLAIGNRDEPYRSRRNVAELGIGTNPYAKRPENVLEAEKIWEQFT